MKLSTEEAVRKMFAEATRHNLARSLKTGEDWDRFNDIIKEATFRIEAEQAAHARDYQTRIAEANEIILREENGVRLDQPLPPGVEKHSDADRLQTKAEARVHQDYRRRIAAINADELHQYRDLTNQIRMRDRPEQVSPSRSQSPEQSRSGPSRN